MKSFFTSCSVLLLFNVHSRVTLGPGAIPGRLMSHIGILHIRCGCC